MISRIIKYYLTLAGFLALLFVQIGFAQEVQVKSALERDTILIGDQLLYRIGVAQPRELIVSFPVFVDTLIGKIEVLETLNRDTLELENEFIQVSQDYLISCFDSGFYKIPEQKITYNPGTGEIDVFSDPAYLLVLTMPLDTSQAIFDIKMPYREPVTLSEIVPYVLAGLLAIAVIFLVVRYFRKYKRKKRGLLPKKPTEPAHIIALRELDRLKGDKLWQNNRVKMYHTRLTEVLRIYLEGRFDVHALEHTSDEILSELKKSGFNDNRLFEKLKDVLLLSDLVKFAKMKPLPQDNETCMLDAYIFINETKPVDIIVEQDSSADISEMESAEVNISDNDQISNEKGSSVTK